MQIYGKEIKDECSKCGETVFTDEVAKRLDDIVKTVSSLMTEIAVVEYTSDKVA